MASTTIETGLAHSSGTQLRTGDTIHEHHMTVSSLQSKIQEKFASLGLPHAEITKVTLQVKCYYTLPNALFDSIYANINLYAYFCNEGSYGSGTKLMDAGTIKEDSAGTYSAEITSYFATKSPWTINTSYSYFSIYTSTSNTMVRNYYCPSVDLIVEYNNGSHSYTTETSRTASTCCTKGSVTKECSCGETQTTELALDPNNHSGGTEVKNASSATCTATGYTGDTYCKGCEAKLSSGSTIAALDHNYTSSVVAPTVTESGYTLHTCSRCGHSYKDNYTALITVNCDTEMGTVEGGGTYNHGDTVSLFAMAKEGYEFVQWSDGLDIDHRLITVTESATYTAIFEKILPPEITSVQMLYSNKQISAENKVPAGEFFRIVVGAVAYDS